MNEFSTIGVAALGAGYDRGPAATPEAGSDPAGTFGRILAQTLVKELGKSLPEAEMALPALTDHLADLLKDDLLPQQSANGSDEGT